jgi:T5SS/PEP-CTERM-associated repeat protein
LYINNLQHPLDVFARYFSPMVALCRLASIGEIKRSCRRRNDAMKTMTLVRICSLVLAGYFLLLFGSTAFAQKIWRSSTNGFWGDTNNWSGHVLPDSSSVVMITNDLTKTVTIDSSVAAANLTIASLNVYAPTGSINTLLVSNGDTNNPLFVFNSVRVDPGGVVEVTNSALGVDIGPKFIHVNGELKLDSGIITLGDASSTTKVANATSGTLTVESGAVSAGALKIGADAPGATGFMNMSGGSLDVSSLFSIGHDVGTTGIVSVVGGQITVTNDDLRIGDSGYGSLTLSNCTLLSTNINIGRDAQAVGQLNIQNGTVLVVSNAFSIARFDGSTGTVVVAGGRLSLPGQKLYAGQEGAGQLTISNGLVEADSLLVAGGITNTAIGLLTMGGGQLMLSSRLSVGAPLLSTGQVSIAAGAIFVTNGSSSAFVSVPNGALTLNGGSITTDSLWLTNSTGTVVFNGGVLNTRNTTVANGAAFVVGNGITPATLYLNGGTHSFANGLTISPNATLAGCGTIIGPISNFGTIATNCSGGLVAPQITALSRAGRTNVISFTTVTGQNYSLEFKNDLTNGTWTAIVPGTNGNAGVVSLTDTNATMPRRFYHVRSQ